MAHHHFQFATTIFATVLLAAAGVTTASDKLRAHPDFAGDHQLLPSATPRLFVHQPAATLWTDLPKLSTLTASDAAALPSHVLHAVAAFDFAGAFDVDVIEIWTKIDGEAVAFQVAGSEGGGLSGYDSDLLCWNENGRPAEAGERNRWAEASWPERQLKSAAAGFEVVVTRTFGRDTLAGRLFSGFFPETPDGGWARCRFTVSRFEPFQIMYDGSRVSIRQRRPERDTRRIYLQIMAAALLWSAPVLVQSMVVWCLAGGCFAAVLLLLFLAAWLSRTVANRNSLVAITLLSGLAASAVGACWDVVWPWFAGACVICSVAGVIYCWQYPPDAGRRKWLQYAVQGVACVVAYIAVSDTGAGEVVVVVQLLLYTLSCAAFARIGQLPLGDHAEHDHAEVDEHPQLWVHNAFRAGANREERLARFHMTGRANAAREVGRLLQTPDFLHHEAQRVELQRQRDVNIFQARACSIVQTAILVGVAVTAMFHLMD